MARIVCIFCMVLAALALGTVAQAQQFPTRPVRFVLGFPAGGPTDAAGRIIAQGLSPALGQSVIVDNRPGADGAIGAEVAAKASPDGHTLLLGGSPSSRRRRHPPLSSSVWTARSTPY